MTEKQEYSYDIQRFIDESKKWLDHFPKDAEPNCFICGQNRKSIEMLVFCFEHIKGKISEAQRLERERIRGIIEAKMQTSEELLKRINDDPYTLGIVTTYKNILKDL
jgi:hypothetical protein